MVYATINYYFVAKITSKFSRAKLTVRMEYPDEGIGRPRKPNDQFNAFLASHQNGERFSFLPAQVQINVSQFEKLATDTVAYLKTQKVDVNDSDVMTIRAVTDLQVFAKVCNARRGGPFNDVYCEDALVKIIENHFQKGLKSMAVLIDQVGRFETAGKAFYPKFSSRPSIVSASDVPSGFIATSLYVGARRLYILPVMDQPLEDLLDHPELLVGLPAERMHWSERNNISQTIVEYAHLLQRVMQRMPYAITDIDLVSGKGTAAQLVGTKRDGMHSLEHLAWSKVTLPISVLQIGAAFGFGYDSDDYWHRYDPEGIVS